VGETVAAAAVKLVRATRPGDENATADIGKYVSYGAGPRATQNLILGAKARAILHGFEAPSMDDLRAVAPSVLRHRVLLNFQADADNVKSTDIVSALIAKHL
jgi:MoxR-like ATPase